MYIIYEILNIWQIADLPVRENIRPEDPLCFRKGEKP